MNKGLTSDQVALLLKKYGENSIQDKRNKNVFIKFFEQFYNFLTVLLFAAALISFFIGETVDGVLIVAIVILNAIFGLYQEQKAEEAVAVLKKMTISTTRVIRDGKEIEIESKYVVPGDIFFIEEGVKIVADGIIIETLNIEINEAALTGESIPVVKAAQDPVYMGTIVSKGRALAEVKKTGMQTKFGKIAAQLSSVEENKTPLQKKLEQLTEIIGLVGILISLGVFGLSILQGSAYFPAFLLAVSLAVAVVPEGLPAVMTITLSVGVKDMAKKKAIMRKLSAIEALGNITLIATDKTGTLTTNKMEVKEVMIDQHVFPTAHLPADSKAFQKLIHNGVLCSTASLVYVHDHGSFEILGDPTEGALLVLAKKIGVESDLLKKDHPIIDERPFDSISKRMSVQIKEHGKKIIYTKGAPESILDICSYILIDGKEHILTLQKKQEIDAILEKWSQKGLRVLAFSYGSNSFDAKNTFLGLVALYDPPRKEAQLSIEKAHAAGINVVMITGDNPKTAEAIGTQIGLVKEGDIILVGDQVEKYTDQELIDLLPKVRIFARITPFHKSRIVSLYQKMGEVVAVTGDGVNDAIALKQADVGIAMGKVGTDVARETADMVITDDNFATIVNAVEEGRNIVKNLKNSIKYLLAGNLTEALTIIIGLLLGLPPILIPIQILYINLISDGIPALALAFSPREEGSMKRKPEKKLQLLTFRDAAYITLVGLAGGIVVVISYFIFDTSIHERQTIAFTVLAIIQSFIFIDIWLSHRSVRKNYLTFRSRFFMVAFFLPILTQYILVSIPFLSKLFNVEALDNGVFIFCIAYASIMLLFIKGIKLILGIKK